MMTILWQIPRDGLRFWHGFNTAGWWISSGSLSSEKPDTSSGKSLRPFPNAPLVYCDWRPTTRGGDGLFLWKDDVEILSLLPSASHASMVLVFNGLTL